MKQIYLVKTTFKAGGIVFMAGDLLEDLSQVRLFKVRMNEGKLIPLPEGKKLDDMNQYFKDRYNIDLKERIQEFRASKGSDLAETRTPDASTPPTGTQKVLAKEPEGSTKADPDGLKPTTVLAGSPEGSIIPPNVVPKNIAPKPLSGNAPKPLSGNSPRPLIKK